MRAELAAKKRDNPIRDFMPVEIDRLFSSPSFQAMKAEQRWWYMSLLLRAWQKVEMPCHLSVSDTHLWMLAGASSAEHFKKHCSIVLGEFETSEDGLWLFNRKQLELYNTQLAKHRAYKVRAGKGGLAKAEKSAEKSACGVLEADSKHANQSTSSSNVLAVEFELEDFDGQQYFIRLCESHPKPEENALASQFFLECVEWAMDRKGFKTRKESAEWIIERAKRYAEVAEFKQGLINWLDKKTFNQQESAWKSGGKTTSNVSEFYDANGVSKFAKSGVSRKLDAGSGRGTGPETA